MTYYNTSHINEECLDAYREYRNNVLKIFFPLFKSQLPEELIGVDCDVELGYHKGELYVLWVSNMDYSYKVEEFINNVNYCIDNVYEDNLKLLRENEFNLKDIQ